ncbi:MAG: ECF transporter S component [Christensenellaceae bacterium]|jgi:niacin transporter|nr:ECF transporter S component [Christensenellaceae bacterium]
MNNTTRKLVYSALCVAIGVVLPMVFHSVEGAGWILLPMHIPVLLCGLLCGWEYGLAAGVLTPLASSLLTGMPPLGYLPPMLVELAIYGLCAGLLAGLVRTKNQLLALYIALIGAMLLGRVAYGIVNALIFSSGQGYSIAAWAQSMFVTALPGIVLQLMMLPSIVFALQRAGLAAPLGKSA